MAIISCPKCDWSGWDYDAGKLSDDALRALQPGQPMPHGTCPNCRAVLEFGATPELDGIQRAEFTWRDPREECANLSQFQRDCLLVALARLTPDHPGFTGSDEIGYVFSASDLKLPPDAPGPFGSSCPGLYLGSWVRPLLVGALYGRAYPEQHNYLGGQADHVRGQLREWREAGSPVLPPKGRPAAKVEA